MRLDVCRKCRLDKDVCLQIRGVRISLHYDGQRGSGNHSGRLAVKPLILPKEAVSCPESLKLVCENRLERRTYDRAREHAAPPSHP